MENSKDRDSSELDSDTHLMTRVACGDMEAFEELVSPLGMVETPRLEAKYKDDQHQLFSVSRCRNRHSDQSCVTVRRKEDKAACFPNPPASHCVDERNRCPRFEGNRGTLSN